LAPPPREELTIRLPPAATRVRAAGSTVGRRPTAPDRYRVYELELAYRQRTDEYDGTRKLVEELQEQLEEARLGRDRVEEELSGLSRRLSRTAKQRKALKSRVKAQKAERAVLTARIAELQEDLRNAREERDLARERCEHLKADFDKAVQAANDERLILIENYEERLAQSEQQLADSAVQARLSLEGQHRAERQLAEVRRALTEQKGPLLELPAPDLASRMLLESQALRLRGPDVGAQLAAVNELTSLAVGTNPERVTAVNLLCEFVRRVCVQGSDVTNPAGAIAVRSIAGRLRNGYDHSVNLAGADLSGANLDECNLRTASLAGASLRRASLRRADLTSADLRGADLQATRLASTNLTGVTGLIADDLAIADCDSKSLSLPDNLDIARKFGRRIVVDRPETLTDEQAIGRLLRQARERLDLGVLQLITRTGLPNELVSRMEEGDPSAYLRLNDLMTVVNAVEADRNQITKLWRTAQNRKPPTPAPVSRPTVPAQRQLGAADSTPALIQARSDADALRAAEASLKAQAQTGMTQVQLRQATSLAAKTAAQRGN
jgi:uncharacterized protein YjbI with pentapeptide repeats